MSKFDGTQPETGEKHAANFGHRETKTPTWRKVSRVGALSLMAVCVSLTLSGCDRPWWKWGRGGPGDEGGYSCPRPALMQNAGFNDQEFEIRYFRRAAFKNDFFAQLELADRYAAEKSTDKNLEDPIEGSVWLVMALANQEGYAPMNRILTNDGKLASRYDKCRAFERARAYRRLDRNLAMMDMSERDKVRDRVVYILSTLGADGFRTLGRLYDVQYGPMGEPADNREAVRAMMRNSDDGRRNVRSLFQRSDVDAYLYNYKATETGDVGAYVLLKDFERSAGDRKDYASFVVGKAKRWVAPYEFYPPEAPGGGVPHSDESIRSDAQDYALIRMEELPFVHVGRALVYLDLTQTLYSSPSEVPADTLTGLRAILGKATTGRAEMVRMTNAEKLRAIQLAAINGSSQAQLALAVMYSEGVGVPADYARAFYWYQQAEKQGSPEARFAMSTYFALGLAGVADQSKASAVVLRLDSAMGGYRPSAQRLRAILEQVSRNPNG
ncbi:tetratricopeptide repeat protein [Asticcacaulis sp. ZE23SCel15]|nr:tetratricopeptide repeat protein [Asticcacaulis sp. ZE23SCel15]WKL55851.1 tetratricopeptide repeat protein [Asticcacaulis sp. ZE23SCel15]